MVVSGMREREGCHTNTTGVPAARQRRWKGKEGRREELFLLFLLFH